ncbi:MAG: GTP pyrophosphokinase [Betaproteobacteria bacterium]|nr:GTP pyrophosphokinase [Betaproteobacteria bacterium]
MSTLEKAILIATQAHVGVTDKAGAPYILHPLRVMLGLSTPEERIVGVLHDVIEDSSVTVEELRARLLDDVLAALESVTKRDGEEYMDFVVRAARNPIGKRVKLADLKDNSDLSRIAAPTERDFARIEKYRLAIELIETMPSTPAPSATPAPTS